MNRGIMSDFAELSTEKVTARARRREFMQKIKTRRKSLALAEVPKMCIFTCSAAQRKTTNGFPISPKFWSKNGITISQIVISSLFGIKTVAAISFENHLSASPDIDFSFEL
jgi:hypothetical protein